MSFPFPAPDLTFVLPLVHPDGEKVDEYGVVEAILRETLTSLTHQQGAEIRVVVVCHKAPAWRDDFALQVTFLTIGDHPGFAANHNHVQVDKGMKYVLGTWYALQHHAPALVMLMDGDDFVRADLSRTLLDRPDPTPFDDGFLLATGYHAALRPAAGGFLLEAALNVKDFNDTCGSCRVFRAQSLRKSILAFQPDLAGLKPGEMAGTDGTLRKNFIDRVTTAAEPLRNDQDGLIRVLGRHVRQKKHFDFARVTEALVAKGCGHGNHDGPKAGEIHWHKVTATTPPERFLHDFSLAGRSTMQPRPQVRYRVIGMLQSLRRMAGQVKRAVFR